MAIKSITNCISSEYDTKEIAEIVYESNLNDNPEFKEKIAKILEFTTRDKGWTK